MTLRELSWRLAVVFAFVGFAAWLEWWGPECRHFWGWPTRFIPSRCLEVKP